MNNIFQVLYYSILKWLTPMAKSDTRIGAHYYRMRVQLAIGPVFGLHRVLIGDSNSAGFAKLSIMRRFKRTTAALGVGGTTATDWIAFFATDQGKNIYSKIIQYEIVWNVGGNHILLNKMDEAEASLRLLHALFPVSWNCTVSPINDMVLEAFSKAIPGDYRDATWYHQSNTEINRLIQAEWKVRTIDLYNWFLSPDNEAYVGVLRDMVHWSNYAMTMILSVVDHI